MGLPALFPMPKRFELTGGSFVPERLTVALEPSLLPMLRTASGLFPAAGLEPSGDGTVWLERSERVSGEGYAVSVLSDRILLEYSSPPGAFYALVTLCQIRAVCGRELPCCRIEDSPGLKLRGVMLDVSRGKIPTLATLKAVADRLAIFKVNHLQLYIEGTSFAYPRHRRVYVGETPITPEELRELSDYCRERFIDLVPCQNSLGHMAHWLAQDEFRPLAECEDGFSVKGHAFPPTTMDVADGRSLAFVEGLLDDLLPCFDSRWCNVCMDEPFELCMGKNKTRADRKYQLYSDYANGLAAYLKERERRMMMWGDVAARDGAMLNRLDQDIMILDWGYEREHPYDARAERLARSDHPFCLCPGTNSWLSFTGMTDNMLTCVKNAAAAAYRYGAEGLIVTDWGDMGHLQYLPVSWPGILYAAALAWNPVGPPEAELAVALNRFVFQDRAGVMGRLCLDAGRYVELEEFRLPCRTLAATPLSSGLVSGEEYQASLEFTARSIVFFTKEDFAQLYLDSYERRRPMDAPAIYGCLEELLSRLPQSAMGCEDGGTVLAEYENGLRMARAMTGLREQMLTGRRPPWLREELAEIIGEHRRLWGVRNKAGGCEDGLRPLLQMAEILKGEWT